MDDTAALRERRDRIRAETHLLHREFAAVREEIRLRDGADTAGERMALIYHMYGMASEMRALNGEAQEIAARLHCGESGTMCAR